MTSRSDGSLLEEINYLTDLIQSHQEAPKCINKSRRKAQYKWKPATKSKPVSCKPTPPPIHRLPTTTTTTRNRVYRPSPPQPSTSTSTLYHQAHKTALTESSKSTRVVEVRHSTSRTVIFSKNFIPDQPQNKTSGGLITSSDDHQRLVVPPSLEMVGSSSIPSSSSSSSSSLSFSSSKVKVRSLRKQRFLRAVNNKFKSTPTRPLPKRKQLKWRRKSLDKTSPLSSSTPIIQHQSSNSSASGPLQKVSRQDKYKWKRRRSSSTYKSITPNKAVTKKRIGRHKKSSLSAAPFKNKVWVPPDQSGGGGGGGGGGGDDGGVGSGDQPLLGHERKTKRGNKQWVNHNHHLPLRRHKQRTPRNRVTPSLVSLNGGRYTVDPSGRRLKRVVSLSSSSLMSPAVSGYLEGASGSSVKRMMASRVVRKSKAYVWHVRRRKNQLTKSKQFCLFYNRFGKCNKGKDCPYIHDPEKIAVCTRFLKGTCDKMNGTCPFSHKITKEKMPVCSYFLRGICTKDDCPYLHVCVGKDAKICPDFLKGYCPRGEKCIWQHTHDCPKFYQTGSCPEGTKCPLRHRRKLERPRKITDSSFPPLMSEPRAFKKIRRQHEAATEGKASQDNPTQCHHGNSSSEPSDPPAPALQIRELDFIPLELNAGS